MKLIIAEKPSVAAEIAKIVGATKKERGYFSGQAFYVAWCVGHLVELAAPGHYDPNLEKWSLDTLPIIPEKYKTIVSPKTADQYKVLKALIERDDVTELIEATDAGREGELIFRLVYHQAKCKKPFSRLWISSMEEKSIRNGLATMKPGAEYDNLFHAALCRQRADWLVGINLTRLYSKMYNRKLTCGRVQTPTINLIVRRQKEIENFIPKTYYSIAADLGSFKAYTTTEDKEQSEKMVAAAIGKMAIVSTVQQVEKQDNPDALYDLTTLQREANRLFGYSAQQTLDYLQKLYDAKLATYPRTDSRYITGDQKDSTHDLLLDILAKNILSIEVLNCYHTENVSLDQIVNDKKVTDHHAVLPTSHITKEAFDKLPIGEKNILLMITYRLLTAVYLPYQYISTKIDLDIAGTLFKATGRTDKQLGYKQIEQAAKYDLTSKENESTGEAEETSIIPVLQQGQEIPVMGISAEQKKTKPTKPYTEDTLLKAMETAGREIEDPELREAMKDSGLGTPATRAAIIENIIKTGYIVRDGKKLLPTETAYTFISLVPDKVKEPEMTAEWEKKLADIQHGEASPPAFMDEVTNFIRSLVLKTKNEYSPAQSTGAFQSQSERESIGSCPICGKHIYEYPKSFSCESGRDGCGFVIWKTIAGKGVSATQAKKLLAKKKSDLIKGFTSKAGKPFDAYLVLKQDNTVGFEFPQKS